MKDDEIKKRLETKVKGEEECTDSDFPYFNPETSTCVQCIECFNCLMGFQGCLKGLCVKKNSPQCANYPVGLLGNRIEVAT